MPARTPEPPYYAVIFSSTRTGDDSGYAEMAARMVELAALQPGFLGIESVPGITISYWESEAAIAAWHANAEHLEAQRLGYARWYSAFELRVPWSEVHGYSLTEERVLLHLKPYRTFIVPLRHLSDAQREELMRVLEHHGVPKKE